MLKELTSGGGSGVGLTKVIVVGMRRETVQESTASPQSHDYNSTSCRHPAFAVTHIEVPERLAMLQSSLKIP